VTIEQCEVAVVGGGPSGAVVAALTADTGHEVVVFERDPQWRWRAGGVFASPASLTALREAGLGDATLADVARPIPAMRVETPGGTTFRLTYGADAGGESAVGFDRSGLDPALLDLARRSGADVRLGRTVTAVDLDTGRLEVREPDGESHSVQARYVVGADGPRSVVAHAAGVQAAVRLPARIGLTYHLADPHPSAVRDARMSVLDDGYVGIAPVAGGRVNVGIVLGRAWTGRLATEGARSVADSIVATIPSIPGDDVAWATGSPVDSLAGAWPLGNRVTRRAGPRWLLVGDAAGFLDPFTGEGLYRGLTSAGLAAAAIRARRRGTDRAFGAYERAMQRRFLAKDGVSWLVQLFLSQPRLFEYAARRVSTRHDLRATLGLAMGDLVGAGRVLDPRFLAALLAP
jgi:flavin-dependent dehydrogenase